MADTSNINERGMGHGELDQDRSGTPLLSQGERALRRQALKDAAFAELVADPDTGEITGMSYEERQKHQTALALFG